jgi:hypothetical protein
MPLTQRSEILQFLYYYWGGILLLECWTVGMSPHAYQVSWRSIQVVEYCYENVDIFEEMAPYNPYVDRRFRGTHRPNFQGRNRPSEIPTCSRCLGRMNLLHARPIFYPEDGWIRSSVTSVYILTNVTISPKMASFITTAVRTSNPTYH